MPDPQPSAHVVNLPRLDHVEREIAALEGRPKPEVIQALKALRVRELAAISQVHADHLGEMTGTDVVSQMSSLTDAVVRHLARRAFARVQAPADWQEQVGVFAVGGYGRGEMCPFSDLDLLVLTRDGRHPDWAKAGYAELQSSLWDVKFQVGAAHRTLPELARLLEDDFVTATAVLERRPLLAGGDLAAAFDEGLARWRRRTSTAFLQYKFKEWQERRGKLGASVFLMEPNLKSNPGGLRDVQLLRNAAGVVFGSRNLFALEELEVVTRRDLTGVLATNDHLLAIRCLLHAHHGRKQDVFQLPDQVRIAKLLGYSDVSKLRAVEHFMRHHYALVLHVHQMVELVQSRLAARNHLGRRRPLIATRKQVDEDFAAVQGEVHLARPELWRLPDAAARLLRMCRSAQQRGFHLSLELQRAIRSHLEVVGDESRHDRALGRLLLEIIGDVGRSHAILADMHACGLLGAFLPEFGNLTCLMQFDSYHQYTVDDHSLLAMRNLDLLAKGQAGPPGLGRILQGVARKDLLALSLLLHDMGKYMGRGHVARGAIMVEGVAHRLGLDAAEEDLVYFLVERHVALSDASRMRNFQEPSFLGPFAERIGDRERLDALYCLTWCDGKAVGEGVLTGWQESLLHELYQAVLARLEQSRAHHAVSHRERLLGELAAAGVPDTDATRHLAAMPEAYPHQVPTGEGARQWRVVQSCRDRGIGLDHQLADKCVLLTLSLKDRHALFADVAATLSGHGFDIIDLRTWIAGDGVVLYHIRMSSIYPARLVDAEVWERLRRDLAAVGAGTLDPRALLARRRSAIVVGKPADSGFDDPAVKVEQRTSDDHTIVDVHTKDEVGLLSRLCRAISDHGCEIGYSCINTMGDVAVDVFYVQRAGRKLTDDDAEALRLRVVALLQLKESA